MRCLLIVSEMLIVSARRYPARISLALRALMIFTLRALLANGAAHAIGAVSPAAAAFASRARDCLLIELVRKDERDGMVVVDLRRMSAMARPDSTRVGWFNFGSNFNALKLPELRLLLPSLVAGEAGAVREFCSARLDTVVWSSRLFMLSPFISLRWLLTVVLPLPGLSFLPERGSSDEGRMCVVPSPCTA